MMMISKGLSVRALGLLACVASCEAFSPSGLLGSVGNRHQATRLRAATIEETTTASSDATAALTTWECDEEAQCVEVPACDEEQCRTSLDVRIHGEWYDLTGSSFACWSSIP